MRRVGGNLKDITQNLKKRLQLYKALYKDERTPRLAKLCLWLAVGYALLPFDLIPDFLPVIGHLDDVIIVPGLIYIALKLIPAGVYEEYKARYLE